MTPQNPQVKPKSQWWHWMVLLIVGLVIVLVPFPAEAAPPSERIFHVDASRFEYDPAIIKVNPGDRVTIELAANDVVHGLSIDGYAIETSADPGKPARITFTADRAGTFRFRCTTTCGNLHPFMIGKLVVGQNLALWRGVALAGLFLVAGIWKGSK